MVFQREVNTSCSEFLSVDNDESELPTSPFLRFERCKTISFILFKSREERLISRMY